MQSRITEDEKQLHTIGKIAIVKKALFNFEFGVLQYKFSPRLRCRVCDVILNNL